jgi:hypothetical protein
LFLVALPAASSPAEQSLLAGDFYNRVRSLRSMMDRLARASLALPPLLLLLSLEAAAAPRIMFDCVDTLACRDVTTGEFAERQPTDKLIEARFPISMLSRGGEADDLIICFYRIESLERTMMVDDFDPKTTLASQIVGNINVEQKHGKSKSIGIALNGGWEPYAKGTGNASAGSDKSENRRYQVAPPMDLLATSGTVSRGAGVYYKLRPSSQTSLEGAKQFTVVFRVPAAWRGGYVRLSCEASYRSPGAVASLDERALCGQEELNIGLYLEGDVEAQRVAEHFATAGFDMRRMVAGRQRDIRHRSLPTPLHHVAALMSVVDPKIPSTWLRHVMLSPVDAAPGDYLRHLPSDVRDAVHEYREAKLQLHLLSGKQQWRVELLKPEIK